MSTELTAAINIYPVCDGCFRGVVIYTLKKERQLIGSDHMTRIRVCESCYEWLGRPELADEVTERE